MDSAALFAASIAEARPRVLAALLRYFREPDLAEDAFQEACLRAMQAWPGQGLPQDVAGWLILVGRNAGLDLLRRSRAVSTVALDPELLHYDPDLAGAYAESLDEAEYRDDVLRLLFMCCHAELAVQDQLALALKVVVGFPVAKIARAFVVSEKAMEQRITRAKKKAAAVCARLETPSAQERAERVAAVSTLIYLLFNEGYSAAGGEEHLQVSLCEEAIRLARLLLGLFQSQPEVMGLLALCLLQHSRWRARIVGAHMLVPLDQQDRRLWNPSLIAEGRVLLEKALRRGRPGPFQIQAAIAAVHCAAATAEQTDWPEIERLYRALEVVQPTPVVTLNRAVAVAMIQGPAAAIALLQPLAEPLGRYLPYHATLAGLQLQSGNRVDARRHFELALQLNPTTAEIAYLRGKVEELVGP